MFQLLADEELPQGMSDILVWPIGLTIAAAVIVYAAWMVERRLNKAPWKWLALVPLVYGVWFGWSHYLSRWLGDTVYHVGAAVGMEKRMLAAHWLSVLLPLFGIAGFFLFHYFGHRLNLPTDDD